MYQKSKTERQVENQLTKNGFEFRMVKQFLSKTRYEVSKDSHSDILDVPTSIEDVKTYIEIYSTMFNKKIILEGENKN